ncbi:PrsW family intramembrane metalloprotease [Microbacterium sp. CJ88]|uniref:PrsW family intramembrane metalloprotease n=1 Tax=Microbacterium sp. CJ88 TaxID=3445672 RepID=UPI003F65DB57
MSYPSPLSQPHPGSPAPIVPPPSRPPALPPLPRKGRSVAIWLIALLVLVCLGVAGYFLAFLGTEASVVGMILALLPLAGVLAAVRLIDRWEPEPRGLVIAAVAWGAVVAVAIALAVDLLLSIVFGSATDAAADAFRSVVQAPIVEEFAKGLGVFVIFASARRAFDGPVDGVVYGALVGAGFAFTENIQYFAISMIEGGAAQVSTTFFLRGILSPFAHVMFTVLTGFALGLAARRGYAPGRAVGLWITGMIGAVVLHALWNGSATFFDFFALYATLQVPLFVLFVLGIVALRREEARLTRARLGDYAAAGWFTAQEVDMLATPAGRRAGIAWARGLRGDRARVMRSFIADATGLAAARQRALSGRDPGAAEDERVLLQRAAQSRAALFAP